MQVKNSLLLFLIICSTALQAQSDFNVPANAKMKTKADFIRYEPTIVQASKWLVQTDLDKEKDKRTDVNKFVLKWATDDPDIQINMNTMLLKLVGSNAQLLGIYIAAYSRSFIENKGSPSMDNDIKAGLQAMITVYKKGIEIKSNKEMKKLIDLADKNQLDSYVKEHFEK